MKAKIQGTAQVGLEFAIQSGNVPEGLDSRPATCTDERRQTFALFRRVCLSNITTHIPRRPLMGAK